MAEKSFYINDEDRLALFEFIKVNNGFFIPDLTYCSDKYTYINNASDLLYTIDNKTVRYFIISNIYTIEPITLKQNRFITQPAFDIMQRKGGPYINIAFYRGYSEDAKVKYKRTDIHYYPYYIRCNSNEEFPASPELRDYYNKIINFLKEHSTLKVIDGKKYNIGNNIINQICL